MHRIHTILYVSDQKRATAFYSALFGREPDLDVPGMTEFRILESFILGLMPEAGIRRLLGHALPNPGHANGIPRAEVYLVMDDPDVFHARALEAGAQELSPLRARDWGAVVSYVLDPDGHVLAFATMDQPAGIESAPSGRHGQTA